MDFRAFSRLMETCSQASQEIFIGLLRSNCPEISGLMNGLVHPGEGFTFRIPMGDGPFTHLSVSVPLDAMGNRGPPYDTSSVPMCIETALVGADGNLVYIDGLEYDDIQRFYGNDTVIDAIPELEAEILRLLPYAQGKKEIPETEEEIE